MHAYIKEESKAVKTPTSRMSQNLNLIAQKIRSVFSRGFVKHQIIYIYLHARSILQEYSNPKSLSISLGSIFMLNWPKHYLFPCPLRNQFKRLLSTFIGKKASIYKLLVRGRHSALIMWELKVPLFPVDVIKTHVRPRTSSAQHGNLDIKMCFSIY